MEKEYLYHLDRSSKKFTCIHCGKKTFVKFKDAEGNYQSDEFGRCDREVNCGFYQYPTSNENQNNTFIPKVVIPKKQVYIPEDIFIRTLSGYDKNVFLNNLKLKYISAELLSEAIDDYYIGTLTKGGYCGAVTFPFIDEHGNINAIQVKTFDEVNKTTKNDWLHSILYKSYKIKGAVPDWLNNYYQNEKKVKCLFGIHLLKKYPTKKIIVVESAKNAIIGRLFLPEFLWLASGSLGNIQAYKFAALKGKEIILIPDTSKDSIAFEQWEFKATEINKSQGTNIKIIDFLDKNSTEKQKEEGYDIADYLMENLEGLLKETFEEPTIYTSATEFDRIKKGLGFPDKELKKLCECIIPENDSISENDFIKALNDLEGLSVPDAKDLIMVMRIKNICDVTPHNNYFLFTSNPF